MSLPDYVRFYNKDNELLAADFVNVGWWITDELFTEVVVSVFRKIYLKDAEYATCYGIKIPKEMFPKNPFLNNFKSFDDYKKKFLQDVKNSHVVEKWEEENKDLRDKLKMLYNSFNEEENCKHKKETTL